jgi:type IV pilus assembly protein PilY1
MNLPTADSAPCTVGTSTVGTVTTVCSKSDVSDYTSGLCSPVIQTGTGPEVTCGAIEVTTAEPSASCALGVGPAPYYETTTACNRVTLTTGDYAGLCTPSGGTGPGWVQTACGERGPVIDHIADSGCVAGFDGATGVRTVCVDEAGGSGHTYTLVTTTTVTTTPYSGIVPTGPPVVGTSSVGPTAVSGGACFATPQAFDPKPPVDIAGCGAWPCSQTTVGAGGSENSLADVAQYYYKTDLRDGTHGPAAMDNLVPKAGTNPEDDSAPHQHMTTFALALGVAGTLKYRDDYRSLSTTVGDFADIRSGVKNWPLWPDRPQSDFDGDSDLYNNPKSIDDFWHTAVNGRGRYFNANNLTSVVQGLGDALAKIDDVVASGTAEAVSTLQPVAGNNFAYSTSYKSGSWQGDVQARLIDPATGALSASIWSAKALLDANTFATCDRRKIFLIRGGSSLVDFTWNTDLCPTGTPTGTLVTSLNATEQAAVGSGAVALLTHFGLMTNGAGATALQQQAAQAPGVLLNFLRGQRANEDFQVNSATKLFRLRDGVLGDIVDSQPVYVAMPFATYQDVGYANFKSTNATRTPMLYVGANDGMLHAFYATTDLADPNHGQEAWAVVPSAVLSNMYKLADDSYKRDGHQFYVDSTPVAGDVYDGANWKTILVGGLSAGGKGYYALDVTVPGVAPTAKWEFKQDTSTCPSASSSALPLHTYYGDCNLGLTFGKPIITKLAGKWVVMFSSGYNNINGVGTDGKGFLYVVDALDGSLIYKIATGVGDAATPSGLGQINNYVDNALLDNTTLRVYGGDMLGNIWRFDFTPSATATLLGTATDGSGVVEPITIRPELAELNGKPFIMVGTGRLLGASDVLDSKIQSVYGIRDPLIGSSPIYPAPLRDSLRPMAMNQTGTLASAVRSAGCTGSAGDCGRPDGWVVDLAEAGERVNVDMKVVLGVLIFSSNVPEQVPCSVGGHSWINQVDIRTGDTIPGPPPFLGNSINVGINVLQLAPAFGSDRPRYVGIARQGTATNQNFQVTPPPPFFSSKRITWREVAQ